jgi:hypothetical protein
MRFARWLLLTLTAATMVAAGARADDPDCAAAAGVAERAWGLPTGLLLAVGLAETGRRDAVSGQLRPDAFSINVAGTDVVFASAGYAVDAVAALRGHGVASIDVGCFQVNLLHHPAAFATLPDAFDPRANADYAGGFLHRLFQRTGSWEAAVAAYHSADPARGGAYRDRVLRFWRGVAARPSARIAVAAVADPHVVRLAAAGAAVPVYTPATLPAALRAGFAALTQP